MMGDFFIYRKQKSERNQEIRQAFSKIKRLFTSYMAAQGYLDGYLNRDELLRALLMGFLPEGRFEFHHAHMLSGGGTNDFDNIKLIENNEHDVHDRIHKFYEPYIKDLEVGDKVTLPYLGLNKCPPVISKMPKEFNFYVSGVNFFMAAFFLDDGTYDFSQIILNKEFKNFRKLRQEQMLMFFDMESDSSTAHAKRFINTISHYADKENLSDVFGKEPEEILNLENVNNIDSCAVVLQTCLTAHILNGLTR